MGFDEGDEPIDDENEFDEFVDELHEFEKNEGGEQKEERKMECMEAEAGYSRLTRTGDNMRQQLDEACMAPPELQISRFVGPAHGSCASPKRPRPKFRKPRPSRKGKSQPVSGFGRSGHRRHGQEIGRHGREARRRRHVDAHAGVHDNKRFRTPRPATDEGTGEEQPPAAPRRPPPFSGKMYGETAYGAHAPSSLRRSARRPQRPTATATAATRSERTPATDDDDDGGGGGGGGGGGDGGGDGGGGGGERCRATATTTTTTTTTTTIGPRGEDEHDDDARRGERPLHGHPAGVGVGVVAGAAPTRGSATTTTRWRRRTWSQCWRSFAAPPRFAGARGRSSFGAAAGWGACSSRPRSSAGASGLGTAERRSAARQRRRMRGVREAARARGGGGEGGADHRQGVHVVHSPHPLAHPREEELAERSCGGQLGLIVSTALQNSMERRPFTTEQLLRVWSSSAAPGRFSDFRSASAQQKLEESFAAVAARKLKLAERAYFVEWQERMSNGSSKSALRGHIDRQEGISWRVTQTLREGLRGTKATSDGPKYDGDGDGDGSLLTPGSRRIYRRAGGLFRAAVHRRPVQDRLDDLSLQQRQGGRGGGVQR